MAKTRPNEPCPCGSGRKFKKCCAGSHAPAGGGLPHTQADRGTAFQKLADFIDQHLEEDEEEAFHEFWGRHLDREGELPPELLHVSRDAHEMWFAFDYELDDGRRVVERFLEQADLTRGERSFLDAMRRSTMRFYEVAETVPGSSMTLRDLLEGSIVTVAERTASRTVSRHDCIAARIIPRGASGRSEIERGLIPISSLIRDGVIETVKAYRRDFSREEKDASLDGFYKLTPPLFHDAWIASIFEPPVPRLANTDGEEMILTRVSFHVDDEDALVAALDGAERDGVSRAGDRAWSWRGTNAKGDAVSLGTIALMGTVLGAEVNSIERGARVRTLVERLVGAAITHRGTTHEDVRRKVMEGVTARALGRAEPDTGPTPRALDPAIAEALVARHYATHYRAWVDEPVPALDGKTPREGAQIRALRPRVEDLIRGLEGLYERALKDGQPVYDPSWMWAELGLETETDASNPPPLAHERVYDRVPGSEEAARAAADRIRSLPAFSDSATTAAQPDLERDLDLQRFLRRGRASDNDAGGEGAVAAPYMPLLVNLELHRRKVFWVDAALSYMLESTDVDVAGRELRAPFPSFAVVFHDRHALSLGERLLSRRDGDPLRGQILRVLTVYVTERRGDHGRDLLVVFAFDALGADLPSLVRYEVPADDEASIRAFLDSVEPRTITDPEVPDASPARGLLRLVLNAILYATSAGVAPEVRKLARRLHAARTPSQACPPESDSVFFLPGKIDIRRVRQLQELERAPDGRALLARFMVRGHWRRPAKNWTEQRLRWIEPYWKGPDIAAVIEKTYRLKP